MNTKYLPILPSVILNLIQDLLNRFRIRTRNSYGTLRPSAFKYGMTTVILIVMTGIFLFVSPSKAFAATFCWAGTGSGAGANWSVAGNWITTAGAAAGAAPGASDVATFDPSKTVCTGGTPTNTASTVDASFAGTVSGVAIKSGYTATITQSRALTISGTAGFVQASTGSIWSASGGSNAFTIDNAGAAPFTLSAGTFQASTGTLTYKPGAAVSWDTTGGTFTPGSGSVLLITNGAGMTMTINSSTTFNNLQISNATDPQSTYSVASGKNPVVTGTLTLSHNTAGSNPCSIAGTGSIHARGNITLSGAGCSGQAPITIDNSTGGNQTLQGDSGQAAGVESKIPGMIINRTSEAGSTLTLQNSFRVDGDFTYTAGTLTTTGSTVIFDGCHTCTLNITGSVSLGNVRFNSGSGEQTTYPIASGTNLTATGTLTMDNTGGQPSVINGTGTITVQGDISTANNGASGTVAITLSGSANQTLGAGATSFPSGTVTFNKSAGTVTFSANLTINSAGQDALVQSGSVLNLSGGILTVNDQFTISGTLNQGTTSLATGGAGGTFVVSTNGTWSNTSTSSITMGDGGLINNGTVIFDGSGSGCGGADAITITKNTGNTTTWSGSGTFTLYDITMDSMTTSLGLTAWSSTNSGGNTGFTFTSGCPSSLPSSSAAFWKFDEGQGTTASDSSLGTSFPRANGTLSGTTAPSWQTEDLCISGKCLYFNGSTSFVNVSTNVVNVQSVAMWVRPNSVSSSALIDLDGGTHTLTVSSGTLTANGFSSPTYYVNGISSNRTLIANQWNYVEVTTATTFAASATTIGKSSSTFFQGFIDEVRLFNTARTAQQVKSDYAGRGASVGASEQASNPINNNPAALSNGLVGSWKMDDSTTVPGTATIVQRTSGAGTTPTTCFSSSTCAITAFGSTVTAGNGIVVVVEGWNSGGAPTITNIRDNRDGVTNYSPALAMSANGNAWIYIYYLPNTAGGATFTVTITYSGSVGETNAVAYEVSGVPTDSTMFNASTSTTGTNATPSTGTVSAGASAKLAFGVFSINEGCGCVVSISNTSSGWTLGGTQTNSSTNEPGNIEHKAAAIGGTSVSDSWNVGSSNGSSGWVGGVATFNGAGVANSSTVDSSGNANTGTLTNGAAFGAGKFGGGVSFDGSDDNISVGNPASLQIPGAITVSAWAYNTCGIFSNCAILSKTSFTAGYALEVVESKATFGCGGSGCSGDITGNTTLAQNTWYHLTAVYIPNVSIKLFVNGVEDGSLVTGVPSTLDTANNFNIGTFHGDTSAFNGKLDEVRVYNRALSPADVFNLYNFAPGPVGKWELEEGSGTTANDTSGNANQGTITAGTGGYVSGKYGKAYNFDNATTKIDAGSGSTLDDLKGTAGLSAETWIYPKSTGEGGAAGGVIIGKATGPTGTLANGWEFFVTTSNALKFTSDGSTDLVRLTSSTLTLNAWSHVAVTWDGSLTATNAHIYINGSEAAYSTTTTGVALTSDAATTLIIGNDSTSADTFDGFIDSVKVYNYPRVQKQVIEDLNAGHPAPGSPIGTPVGYWKFDEGYGNSTGNAHNSGNCASTCAGTITGMASPATSTSGWTQSGKFSKALLFDGTNDYVAMPSDVTQLKITSDLSLSAWINLTSTASQRDIICKWTNTAATSSYCLYTNSSGQLVMGISDGSTITTTTETAQTLSTSTWYHVTGVFSGSNSVTLYINGIQVKQNTTTIPATLGNSTTILDIGAENAGTNPMNGVIDEPKVFAGALTADQVKIDMNYAQVEQLGAAGNKSTYQTGAANQEYCVPGDTTSCAAPTGRFDLEEGTGSTINDTSGNGGTGVTTNSPAWITGKIGKALNFNGTNNYARAGTTTLPATTYTISFWMNADNASDTLTNEQPVTVATNGSSDAANTLFSWRHPSASFQKACTHSVAGTFTVAAKINDTMNAGTWYFVTCSYDGTNIRSYLNGVLQSTTALGTPDTGSLTNPLFIGSGSTSNNPNNRFPGKIDQVKYFNYARTPAQVAWDYNKGGPVSYWKMDECTGTSIKDSSGNSNTGTLTIGGSGTQTTAGTCTTSGAWFNGVTGKRNYSLNFDGTDDYISLPTGASVKGDAELTISGWTKFTSTTNTPELYAESTNNNGSIVRLDIFIDDGSIFCSNGKVTVFFKSNENATESLSTIRKFCSNTVLSTNTWYHVAVVINHTTDIHKIYINGRLDSSNSIVDTGTAFNSNNPSSGPILGSEFGVDAGFWSGQLDEIKMYNYELTSTQVQQLYNNGAVNFAPSQGAP